MCSQLKIIEIGDFIFEGKYSLHSAFNNISNFINNKKNIVSISQDAKYLSPNSIIIFGLSHKEIKSIKINKEYVFINDLKFDRKKIVIYNSQIDFINKDLTKKTIRFIKENFLELKHFSIAFLIDEKLEINFKSRFELAFVKHIKSAWNEIENGIFLKGIKKMKGSGIGLTPSGDDFITGILYALFFIEKTTNKDTNKLRKSIYKTAESKNYISRNMMFHASNGLYFKQFKDFQLALINNDKNILRYFRKLINIGETSGSDMITGYYLSLKLLK